MENFKEQVQEKLLYKTIGQNIRYYRLKNKMSQLELANEIGVSPTYIGKIERGERRVPLSLLIKIAEALNLSLDDLIEPIIQTMHTPEDKELKELEEQLKKTFMTFPKNLRKKLLKELINSVV